MWRLRLGESSGLALVLLVCTLLAAGHANATTLDWDVVGWPGGLGTLQNTFSDVDASGVDIDVTFVDSSPASLSLSPNVNNALTPPSSPGDDLFIQADGNNDTSGIVVTFDFSGVLGVTFLSFNLFDVDSGIGPGWTDIIDLSASPMAGGPAVLPTSVLPANASPSWSYNSGSGRITGNATSASDSDNGTALVTFATPITSFQLVYLNDHDDAGNQLIGISDVTFTPVPESDTLPLLASGLALLGLLRRRA